MKKNFLSTIGKYGLGTIWGTSIVLYLITTLSIAISNSSASTMDIDFNSKFWSGVLFIVFSAMIATHSKVSAVWIKIADKLANRKVLPKVIGIVLGIIPYLSIFGLVLWVNYFLWLAFIPGIVIFLLVGAGVASVEVTKQECIEKIEEGVSEIKEILQK
jgi:hypothetical protein